MKKWEKSKTEEKSGLFDAFIDGESVIIRPENNRRGGEG